MELSKHKNHRNNAYLAWLRKQKCAITGQKAQCAHHIRLGTNGGSSLKPSDYFCIPLLNEFHTSGLFALHIIGEGTFFELFKLNRNQLFIGYLKKYLKDKFKKEVEPQSTDENEIIAFMIQLIEELTPKRDTPKKAKKSITENEFYQKSMELKKLRDRELRAQIKEDSITNSLPKSTASSFKGNEFYEKAKELKRIQDRELRQKMKSTAKKQKVSTTQSEYYEKAKEFKRVRDKELRAELKLSQKKTTKKNSAQSEYYEKAKEYKRVRDKELRAELKLSQNKTVVVNEAQAEYYQQAKELKRKRDKEFRQKLKEQRKAATEAATSL